MLYSTEFDNFMGQLRKYKSGWR